MTEPAWAAHCGDLWRAHVLAAIGRDVCDIVGPSPRSRREWIALMRRVGARCMRDVIAAVHGEPIPYRTARRGDVVRRGWAIGVCRGERAEFFGGEMVAMRDVDDTWAVAGSEGAWARS